MGVAGDVGQQVPQRPVGHPRLGPTLALCQPRDLGERDLQFIERLGTALVHPRCLRGGADEPAGEQVGQRRVALPVGQQRHQQVGSAQQRRIGRGDAAQRDVVAAAGAAVRAVDVEGLGRQPRQPGLLVEGFQLLALLGEAGRGGDVDLDDARVGGDAHRLQPRVGRRPVAFDDDRAVGLRGGRLHAADQVDEVLQHLGGRQVDVEQPVANLGDQRRGRRARRLRPRSPRRSPGPPATGRGWPADRPRTSCRGGRQLIDFSGSRSPAGESPSSSTMRPRRSRQSALAQPESSSRRCSGST